MAKGFTDRAIKIMEMAREQAVARSSSEIAPEDILLAILDEGAGVGALLLQRLVADLSTLRQELQELPKPQHAHGLFRRIWRMLSGNSLAPVAGTSQAWDLQTHAAQECDWFGHDYIASEHLLLSLLHDSNSVASRLLIQRGLSLTVLREELVMILGPY